MKNCHTYKRQIMAAIKKNDIFAHIVCVDETTLCLVQFKYGDYFNFINVHRIPEKTRDAFIPALLGGEQAKRGKHKETIVIGPVKNLSAKHKWILNISKEDFIRQRMTYDTQTIERLDPKWRKEMESYYVVNTSRQHYEYVYDKITSDYSDYEAISMSGIESALSRKLGDSVDAPSPISVVAHIAGTTGSGKTHLGLNITRPYIIKDLDDFFVESGLDRYHTTAGQIKHIDTAIKSWIVSTVDKYGYRPILFVGYDWMYNEALSKTKKRSQVSFEAQLRYFIDIDRKTHAQQFAKREIRLLCEDEEKAVEKFSEGKLRLGMSKEDLDRWYASDYKYYTSRQYDVFDREKISEEVSKIFPKLCPFPFDFAPELFS